MPASRACEPAAHALGEVEPSGQKLPSGQAVHALALPRSVRPFECVPRRHGSAALAPSEQNDPSKHGRQLVAFASGCRVPGAHGTHASKPITAA